MKILGVIILIFAVIGVGSYFLLSNNKPAPTVTTPIPTPSAETVPTSLPTVDASDLQAGGSSYRESQGVYVFLYPSDFKLDESDKKHIRIYKTGATQKGQTEMYDGVIIVFETIALDGQSLSSWVDQHIKTITADGTSQVEEPKKSITHKTYPGFTYATRGLGSSKNYVLQKDTSSPYAVLVTMSVNDPQNVGFQKEVDKTLATLELLK